MKITSKSHIDHGLQPEHIRFIEQRFGSKETFFIETAELPMGLPMLPCSLVGPATGYAPVHPTEVEFKPRGKRLAASRMLTVISASARGLLSAGGQINPPRTRKLTVIGGIDVESGECILFTAYGGPLAPREVGDPNITDSYELVECFQFWQKHALLELEGS